MKSSLGHMYKAKKLEIEWEDSHLYPVGWRDESHWRNQDPVRRCRSLGYVVREDVHGVILAGSVNGDNVTGCIFVPAAQIRRRRIVHD